VTVLLAELQVYQRLTGGVPIAPARTGPGAELAAATGVLMGSGGVASLPSGVVPTQRTPRAAGDLLPPRSGLRMSGSTHDERKS
jgi:hypothetical protein